MHVLENVYFVYICSIFSLHCFVQFAENKDIVLYCIVVLYWLCTHSDLDHYRYDLGHGHDIPSVHGQILCKIVSRSNVAVRSYAWTRNLPMCSR